MTNQRLLYLVCCGAGPAERASTAVTHAHNAGWRVQVIATPAAVGFIDTDSLEDQTGRPVRNQYRKPGQPRSERADAILVAPATLNTICKLAAGISDTYALGILNEAIGLQLPIAVLPFLNQALAARAPYRNAIQQLRNEGVHVLDGPDGIQPHPPHTGGTLLDTFPWQHGLQHLADRIKTYPKGSPRPAAVTDVVPASGPDQPAARTIKAPGHDPTPPTPTACGTQAATGLSHGLVPADERCGRPAQDCW